MSNHNEKYKKRIIDQFRDIKEHNAQDSGGIAEMIELDNDLMHDLTLSIVNHLKRCNNRKLGVAMSYTVISGCLNGLNEGISRGINHMLTIGGVAVSTGSIEVKEPTEAEIAELFKKYPEKFKVPKGFTQ